MNRYEQLMARIEKGERILIDGGTGTEVERRGVPNVAKAWSGGGALTHPEILQAVHEDYIRAGAEIVISNTFSTSRHVLQDAGWEEHFDLLNRRGVELAVAARAACDRPDVLVAGGLTHWSFTRTLPNHAELRANMAEQANIYAEAGADLLMLEMMADIELMSIVLEATRSSGLPVWVGLSCKPDEEGTMRLLMGPTLAEGLTILNEQRVPLISIMHTQVEYVSDCLKVIKTHWSGPVGVYAHSGRFVNNNWIFNDVISAAAYAGEAAAWLERGVQVIGGCCGTGVEHIAALRSLV